MAYNVTKKYIVVEDVSRKKVFIDDSTSMIRNFEKIIDDFDTIKEAAKKYPDAIIVAADELYEEVKAFIENKGLNIPSEADDAMGTAMNAIADDEYNQDD